MEETTIALAAKIDAAAIRKTLITMPESVEMSLPERFTERCEAIALFETKLGCTSACSDLGIKFAYLRELAEAAEQELEHDFPTIWTEVADDPYSEEVRECERLAQMWRKASDEITELFLNEED